MKKIIILVMAVAIPLTAFAQSTTPSIADIKTGFTTFAQDVANSLPLNSAVGLTWSDAFIGKLPHFGLGATVGFSTIPFDTVTNMAGAIGIPIASLIPPEALTYVQQYGLPFPAYTVDARIGGIGLPFDIGVKVGYVGEQLPDAIKQPLVDLLNGIDLNYLLAGADIRIPLTKEGVLMPSLSVGGGFNYLSGQFGLPSSGDEISLSSFDVPTGVDGSGNVTYDTYTVSMTSPALNFNWDAKVIDLKAQLSKRILIFTPYAGFGASKGFESAGGGITSTLKLNGQPVSSLSQTQKDQIDAFLVSQGLSKMNWNNPGFVVAPQTAPGGWAFRVFGGTSVDLLILHLDLGVMYDFLGKNYGGTVNLRIQF